MQLDNLAADVEAEAQPRTVRVDVRLEVAFEDLLARVHRDANAVVLDCDLVRSRRELCQLDLDRLDRIAKTLRTVEPIRPKAEGRKASSLRSLVPVGEESSEENSKAGI